MYRNYIFDLDGTIINSSKEVLLCFEKAFKKADYIIDKSRLTPNVIGPPLNEIIKLIAPEITEKDINRVVEYFRELYDFEENDISEFYPGIPEVLEQLKNANKKLFIATYKPEKPTMRIIKQFKLDKFDDIYTIDKFGEYITKTEMINDIIKKYNLNKSETVMIGDAPSDVIGAKEAGVLAIGALWGYGENKEPLIQNADIVIDSANEILNLKERMLNV